LNSIFISHSGRENDVAIKVRDWLRAQGWADIFIDLDPASGLGVGRRWQDELRRAGERCAAVVVLVSPAWIASFWCRTEFLVAVQLGKLIFPVIVATTPKHDMPAELVAHFQLTDISSPKLEGAGLERLSAGLKRAGLDPSYFPWPPPNDPWRSPYRGLGALEAEDAAIFFGRDAAITKALDGLRRIRAGERERGLVVVGVSGSGKSSFLRAGILSRLRRDEANFLPLRPIRPERATLTGPQGFIAALQEAVLALASSEVGPQVEEAVRSGPDGIVALFAAIRAPKLETARQRAEAGPDPYAVTPPTIAILIDQAEELFDKDNAENSEFLQLLTRTLALDSNALFIATIRSESYASWQSAPELVDLAHILFNLPPLSPATFKEVIEGPGKLSRPPLLLKPDLVEKLISDLDAGDALPLLAATLERLHQICREKGEATIEDYVALGGLTGTISRAAEAALELARNDPRLPTQPQALLALTRQAFIPRLVSVDLDTLEPKRRQARAEDLPPEVHRLLVHFVSVRLLTADRRAIDGRDVEVLDIVHEAVLRQWPFLASWIAQERDELVRLESISRSAAEWDRQNQAPMWLDHQEDRLRVAEQLSARPDYAATLGETAKAYLDACRALDQRRQENERARLEREQRQVALTRRLQRVAGGLLIIAAALVALGGLRAVFIARSENLRASRILAEMSRAAADRGLFDSAARLAISGIRGNDAFLTGFDPSEADAALVRAANAMLLSRRFAGQAGIVIQAAVSPDGRKVISADADGTARVWDIRDGQTRLTLKGHDDWVMSAQFSPRGDQIMTASQDNTVRFWDARTGREVARLPTVLRALRGAAYSSDGNLIVTASGEVATIWNVHTLSQAHEFSNQHAAVLDAAFSRDGFQITTGSDDGIARVWDARSGNLIAKAVGHIGVIDSVAFDKSGARIVTGGMDSTARVWNAKSGDLLLTLRGHDAAVSAVRFSDDGLRIATSSDDGTARIWDALSGRELVRYVIAATPVNSVAFSRDGRFIVTGDNDRQVKLWRLPGDIVATSDQAEFSAVFSRSGRTILVASQDGRAHEIDAVTGRDLLTTGVRPGSVATAVFSPDESQILTASTNGEWTTWDAANGREVRTVRIGAGPVDSAAFSPDGQHIITASLDGVARIWDARTGRLINSVSHSPLGVASAYFSPDGASIITAGGDQAVRIWDAGTYALKLELRGHEALVNDAQFSPDGSMIISAADDAQLRLWDARSGRLLRVLRGHGAGIRSVAVSDQNDRIASASADRTVRIWDIRTGHELYRFEDFVRPLRFVAFSRDGGRVVSTAFDNSVRVDALRGPLAPIATNRHGAALIEAVCRDRLTGNLSVMEDGELATVRQLGGDAARDVCGRHATAAG